MPELNIKQEFGKTYIVTDFYQTEEEYLVRMITDNEIKGHLSCRVSYEGNRKKLMYEVTNMISLSAEYENKYIELDELRYIFEEIQNIYSIGNNTHYKVGKKIRQTIKDLGGTMPEDLPTPKKSIKELEKENIKTKLHLL